MEILLWMTRKKTKQNQIQQDSKPLNTFFTTTRANKSSQQVEVLTRGTWPDTNAEQLRQGQGKGLRSKAAP